MNEQIKASEEWKDVVGYEGIYQVSTHGNVRSLDRVSNRGRRLKGKNMKLCFVKDRYVFCNLCDANGKDKTLPVHRVVAAAFHPNPLNKKTVNHIDGNKHNNAVSNLEWATFNENMQHAYDTGLLDNCRPLKGRKCELHLNCKLLPLDIEMIKCLRKGGFNYDQIARRFNIHYTQVSLICRGKSWQHLTNTELKIEL